MHKYLNKKFLLNILPKKNPQFLQSAILSNNGRGNARHCYPR